MTELKWNAKSFGLQKVFAFLLAMCVCVTSVGMNVNAQNVSVADKIDVKADKSELKKGESATVTATITTVATEQDASASSQDASSFDAKTDLTWTVDNESALTIEDGEATSTGDTATPTWAATKKVTAKEVTADTDVTITVTANNQKVGTVVIKVKAAEKEPEPEKPEIKVNKITLDKTALSLEKGAKGKLTAAVGPNDAANKTLKWSSSNAGIATVDQSGNVTAVAKGSAIITVEATDGSGIKATCTVTVTEKPAPVEVKVSKITLNKTALKLTEGGKEGLTATVTPKEAKNQKLQWSSSNSKIATVDQSGNVTAVAKGSATITAAATDGSGVKATCAVTVEAKKATVVNVKSVKLNKTKLTLNQGKSETLKVTFNPSNASNKSVTWSSNNKKVATVDSKGKVTAKGKGTAKITVTTKDGSKKATCTVTVKLPSTKVTVNCNKTLYIQKGKKVTFKATMAPVGTTDSVTVTSSNSKVAKVSGKKGEYTITGVKAGKATITVKTSSKKSTKITVHVSSKATKATKVKLNKTKATLAPGKTLALKATVTPVKTTEAVTWKTSNKKVATVDKYGVVTAKKAGTATITVTVGKKKATCKITVPGVTLQKTSGTVKVGKSLQIKVKKATTKGDKIKSCTSSNTKIATVNKSGKITGKKAGKATITVTMKSGATAKFTVTVKR